MVVSYGQKGRMGAQRALSRQQHARERSRARRMFLRVWSDRLPGDTDVVAVNNLTVGIGIFTLGAKGRFDANFPALSVALGDVATLDFRLAADSLLRRAGTTPPIVDGRSLAPTAEFKLPFGTSPIPAHDSWAPGAFQTTDPLR